MLALLVDSLANSKTLAGSGLGSTFYKLDAAAEAKKHGWQLDYLTNAGNKELVFSSNIYRKIYTEIPQNIDLYSRIVSLGVESARSALTMLDFEQEDLRNYKTQAHQSFWRHFLSARLGYETGNEQATSVDLAPSQTPLPERLEQVIEGTLIGISVDVVSPLKYFNAWTRVSQLLVKHDPATTVVYLGSRKIKMPHSQNVINLSGETSLTELIRVIASCSAIVGVDGLHSHLAMRLGIPSVMLFSMIEPEHVIPTDYFSRDAVVPMVNTGCPYQFCYSKLENYRTSGCMLKPNLSEREVVPCMQFKAEEIVKTTLNLLNRVQAKASG
jgi:hypothetical protein